MSYIAGIFFNFFFFGHFKKRIRLHYISFLESYRCLNTCWQKSLSSCLVIIHLMSLFIIIRNDQSTKEAESISVKTDCNSFWTTSCNVWGSLVCVSDSTGHMFFLVALGLCIRLQHSLQLSYHKGAGGYSADIIEMYVVSDGRLKGHVVSIVKCGIRPVFRGSYDFYCSLQASILQR